MQLSLKQIPLATWCLEPLRTLQSPYHRKHFTKWGFLTSRSVTFTKLFLSVSQTWVLSCNRKQTERANFYNLIHLPERNYPQPRGEPVALLNLNHTERRVNPQADHNGSVKLDGCVGELVSNAEIPSGICRTSELKLKAKIIFKNKKIFLTQHKLTLYLFQLLLGRF